MVKHGRGILCTYNMFSLLEESQLYANMTKSTFVKEEVEYLSHVISKEGVKVDPRKIKAIMEWPKPNNRLKLRRFIGLIGYYRGFIKNYVYLATQLSHLLKKK
jgi:hypothetical protein